jgi:Glycosyl-hydrolase family 116, catalytic region
MTAREPNAAPILIQRPDGLADALQPVVLPIMAPRLQGACHPGGWLDLALWGAGDLGRVRFSALSGPYRYGPNRITTPAVGVHVAQSATVLALRGVTFQGLYPARRCASWARRGDIPARTIRSDHRWSAALDWGVIEIEQRGADLVVAVGASAAEAAAGLAMSVDAIVAEGDAHVRRCDQLPNADPILRGMVMQGVHAALSSIRADEAGRFAGLAAGLAYSAPARTYYRDGYWTLQSLLSLAPEAVRSQVELLAEGLQTDGEAPSGVIVTGPVQSAAWERLRQLSARSASVNRRPKDWWSDHFDSPLFFVLTLADYVRATGDYELVKAHWPLVRAVFERYRGFDADGCGLPLKPRHDRDWADNVYREGAVAYDLGLWVGVLDAIAELGALSDPDLAKAARALAVKARTSLEAALWRPQGWYADYAAPDGFVEDHLALDSLTLLRYGAAPAGRASSVLAAAGRTLESRGNPAQGWGDWGMLCAFPPFKRRADIRAKSAFAFRYHNGADWPWLDGLYAGELLRRGLPGWRYPLTRWWEVCLHQGWAGAVEYFSPPFGRGSLLQGWSSLPAAVALAHQDQLLAGDPAVRSSGES